MNDEINYKSNPLNGVGLKKMLVEIVDHYGFEILYAYLNINCFKTNPSIESSVKFLKKTDWAREKVESFYMYQFKNLPKASSEQYLLSPRDRIVPEDQKPGEPAKLSLEDAERLRAKRAKKSDQRDPQPKRQEKSLYRKSEPKSPDSQNDSAKGDIDPWAKWKNK